MGHAFVTCDVFTDVRFGGNPLAVLLDARGLTASQMQQVAREFNYSETTFVLPPERAGDRRVRIFTPTREVPFAGHPNVGTAFVLATLGELGTLERERQVVLEEPAGDVPVTVRPLGSGRFRCELRAPEPPSVGPPVPVGLVATAMGLEPGDVATDRHAPCVASVGLPFVLVELRDEDALRRARPDEPALRRLLAAGAATADVHCYVRTPDSPDGVDLRTRMFAPFDGVPEDPATGSANAALAGLLSALAPERDGDFAWTITQGVEMGRPSRMDARTEKRLGQVLGVWIGGESVLVSRGTIEV
ncbi:MAG: PhzF family phenazine biosynthesis protein [Candidatus Nanopelagicales bacterium]|nr:PhzF family phenazine biosynthesis protein [Candidatus Nanopelagicales bacterium]